LLCKCLRVDSAVHIVILPHARLVGPQCRRHRDAIHTDVPDPTASQLAIDAASEVICAGTRDTFEIFVWSVQTGRLLEILAGHEGPVTSLAFNPVSAVLCSGSWDHEVREGRGETFGHSSATDMRRGLSMT
jgi:periodic tryptophan protein 2